ncbi:X-linked interleukin-1 receptor accessory protein-like 2 [Ciona intestinalis]
MRGTMCWIAYVWATLVAVVAGTFSVQRTNVSNCTESGDVMQIAFMGWPHRFYCNSLIEHTELVNEYYDNDELDFDNVQCSVFDIDKGILLYNATEAYANYGTMFDELGYTTPDIQSGDSTNYQINFMMPGMVKCESVFVHLNITKFENRTCEESILDETAHHVVGLVANARGSLKCMIPTHVQPKFHVDVEDHVTWLRNCVMLEVGTNDDFMMKSGGHLSLPSVTYQHPGTYTCAVTYNGMTRYTVHHRVCVKPKSNRQLSIKCSASVYKHNILDDVRVECTGYLAHDVDVDSMRVVWTKENSESIICSIYGHADAVGTPANSRTSCSIEVEKICFREVQDSNDIDAAPVVIDMKLKIRNLKKSDFGRYEVTMFQRTLNQTAVFKIQSNFKPWLVRHATITGVAMALILLLLMFTAVLWWKRVYLFVYYKRKFGTNEPDNKCYGAFLSYHFSTDMDKFAKQLTRDAVSVVRDGLEGLGYRVYDEVKDGQSSGYHAPNIINTMRKCHKVIIIITPDYLKDHWSMFTLQKSFLEMIEARSKMIFILTPGSRAFIKQHRQDNESCRLVHRAIALNHALQWSDERRFDLKYFLLRLENVMPKLVSQRFRHVSHTSSVSSQPCRYNNGYLRSMSNDTQITELGSPSKYIF